MGPFARFVFSVIALVGYGITGFIYANMTPAQIAASSSTLLTLGGGTTGILVLWVWITAPRAKL